MPVFKQPSYTTDVNVWKWMPDDLIWVQEEAPLQGQVYTPIRNADEEEGGLLYFVYRSINDVLRDEIDYGNTGRSDVISFGFPLRPETAARTVAYRVTDVQPRWLKFTNEHLMATLRKLTPAEWAEVMSGEPVEEEEQEGDLPAFNTEFVAYIPDEEFDNYHVSDPFDGQLVAPQPMAEVIGYQTMFCFVPKEVTSIPNPADVQALPEVGTRHSYIRHTWNGRDFLWQVQQIVPRFANFEHEHWMLFLVQVGAADAQEIYDVAIAPGLPYLGKCTIEVSPTSLIANNFDELTVTVTVLDFFDDPVVGATVVLSPTSGTSHTADDTIDTDGAGEAVFVFKNFNDEAATTYEAELTEYGLTIGPSDPVEWTAPVVDEGLSSAVIVPDNIPGDEATAATLTITIVDGDGNPLQGVACFLSTDGEPGPIHNPVDPALTNAAGQTVVLITAPSGVQLVTYFIIYQKPDGSGTGDLDDNPTLSVTS